jgi:predicted nucleic acid-binding protein
MNKTTSCDSSVLINFLRVDRLDLIDRCSFSFVITDHVMEEISNCFSEQRDRLEGGLVRKIIQIANVEAPEEFELFGKLSETGQLGAGECAAIAIAVHREYHLAIDDNQAIRKTTGLLPSSRILRTQDLVLTMIQEQILELNDADKLIQIWADQHRFKLPIKSFSELLNFSILGTKS